MQKQVSRNIRQIMEGLVAVQSDTGTPMEQDAAKKIASYFADDPYFRMHPDCWGMEDTGDFMGRTVVWALKRGTSGRTLILTGHYDAVEIDCYGDLKPFALQPQKLKEEILRQKLGGETMQAELASGEWLPGRGTADMKGGLAVGIYKTLTLPEDAETGLLFVTVCDEENISAGMRGAVDVLLKIRERFALTYTAALILEPQLPLAGNDFMLYNGSIGKMLPMIVAKGKLAHCGEPLKGLNAAHLIAEIAARIDLNTDFITEDFGLASAPPVVQILKDLKQTYDVSLPELGVLCVNLLFLGENALEETIAKLRRTCEEAGAAVMEKYERAYRHAAEHGLITDAQKLKAAPRVLLLPELEALAAEHHADFAQWKQEQTAQLAAEIQSGALTLQNASVLYIRRLLAICGDENPMLILAIAPPYYPAVCNAYLAADGHRIVDKVREVIEDDCHMDLTVVPYFTGIGDASYLSCTDPSAQRKLLGNLTLPISIYDIPFESSAKLGAPIFYLGPRCRDIHQWSERVYLPDLEQIVPDIIDRILDLSPEIQK